MRRPVTDARQQSWGPARSHDERSGSLRSYYLSLARVSRESRREALQATMSIRPGVRRTFATRAPTHPVSLAIQKRRAIARARPVLSLQLPPALGPAFPALA